MKYLIFIILLLLLALSTTKAEVYRWTDENGVKHFGNQPPPNGVDYTVEDEIDPASEKNRSGIDIGPAKKEIAKGTMRLVIWMVFLAICGWIIKKVFGKKKKRRY